MTSSLNFLPLHRLHQVLKSVWEKSSQCWPGSVTEGVLSRGWLRRFLLLKLVTVLLFPHGAGFPLLVGCMFSLRAFLLLHSPQISTKPSTVLLGQLALTDTLVLLQWVLRLAATVGWWMEEASYEEARSLWHKEAVNVLCQQLLDTHHLASLLLLGLLGLEATLVSRWPQQTRRFRTSHWAQLTCGLIWILVLLELVSLLDSRLLQDLSPPTHPPTLQNTHTSSLGLVLPPSLPGHSVFLRRTLWLVNSWLHYAVFNTKPHKKNTLFH
ncbi:uncharacterized protein LOC125008274 [Mugil cephalus]|uniref:uncharacterized protein LOC125008274 n=1 Tax=Mugil cephalus TaxID=48193 RepID=UPI001FB65C6A|nr:uncharacterized protein LOC125008274 [Mugil cephalus]